MKVHLQYGTTGLAIDGQHIYWSNFSSSTIGRANLDGSAVNQSFITGATNPGGVAVDGQHIYWTNEGSGAIGRAKLDGGGVNESFITGLLEPWEMAVDAHHIYWNNYTTYTIGRANLDGSGANSSFITGTRYPTGLAVTVGAPPGTPSNTSPPVISGIAQAGNTLSASNGTWSGSTPITYQSQWRLCGPLGGGCADIPGQTASAYVLTTADVGHALRVRVTANDAAGSSSSVSAPTAKVSRL